MRKGIGNWWQVQTPERPHPESQKTSYQKQIRHDIRWNWNWKRTGTPSSIHTISMSEPNAVCDLSNNTTQSIKPGSQKIGFAQIESNRCSHRPRGASSHFQLCTFTAKPYHWPALEHKVPEGFQQVVCNIYNICIFQFCTSIGVQQVLYNFFRIILKYFELIDRNKLIDRKKTPKNGDFAPFRVFA